MNSKKEEPFSVLNHGSRTDPILNRSGSRGFGLPPPGKFRSGHLPPTALPVSRVIPGDDSASVSGNDITSESEEEDVYGGRYSVDSSPQDDRAPSSIASSYRYSNARSLPPTRMSYGSDYLSSDVYSSVELTGKRGERSVKGNGRYPVAQNGYAEDESEDSAGSSEFSSSQVGSNIRTASHSQLNASEGYASSVTSRMIVGKVCYFSLNVLYIVLACYTLFRIVYVFPEFPLDFQLRVIILILAKGFELLTAVFLSELISCTI